MTFNEILYYLLRKYAGKITRKYAAKIAAKMIQQGAYDWAEKKIHIYAIKEVNKFLNTPESKSQIFKKSDFAKNAIRTWQEYEEEQEKEKEKTSGPDDGWKDGEEEGEWIDEEGGTGVDYEPINYEEEVDAIIDKIWDAYSGTSEDAIENQNLLDDIISQARENMTDQEIYEAIKKAFPDYKKTIEGLSNSIYDNYYGRDGRGAAAAFKKDVSALMDVLGVEDSIYKWWP